jgi:transposase
VDRYAGYFALLGADWRLQLAYCWSHQRRDFVNLGQSSARWAGWAGQWVGRINQLFALNAQRRQAWFKEWAQPLAVLDQEVRRQVQELKESLDRELAGGQLAGEPEKILQSMRRHWSGLTVFVDHHRCHQRKKMPFGSTLANTLNLSLKLNTAGGWWNE